jgi:hypothetical protein
MFNQAYRLQLRPYLEPLATNPLVEIVTSRHSLPLPMAPTVRIVSGSIESYLVNPNVTRRSSNLQEIPVNPIGYQRLLSRELVGCWYRFERLHQIDSQNMIPILLNSGIVTGQTLSPTKFGLELTTQSADTRTLSPYVTSTDCMNSLGQQKCQFSLQTPVARAVAGISNRGLVITLATPFTTVTGYQYELLVGRSTYLLDSSLMTVGSSVTVPLKTPVSGRPSFVYIRENCNRTLAQCNVYGQTVNFNGNLFLRADTVNINL